jgi:hypothetical protein
LLPNQSSAGMLLPGMRSERITALTKNIYFGGLKQPLDFPYAGGI